MKDTTDVQGHHSLFGDTSKTPDMSKGTMGVSGALQKCQELQRLYRDTTDIPGTPHILQEHHICVGTQYLCLRYDMCVWVIQTDVTDLSGLPQAFQ